MSADTNRVSVINHLTYFYTHTHSTHSYAHAWVSVRPHSAGADSTIKDSQGLLPLHHACMSRSYQCVKIILDQPQQKGLTGLKKAMSLLSVPEAAKDIIKLVEVARQK